MGQRKGGGKRDMSKTKLQIRRLRGDVFCPLLGNGCGLEKSHRKRVGVRVFNEGLDSKDPNSKVFQSLNTCFSQTKCQYGLIGLKTVN